MTSIDDAHMPTVSVIVPCYNLGAYLDEAIQSVLAQSFDDYEVLVLDDGSTDEQTLDLFSTARWPRTRVFRRPNRGLAAARNFLIKQSTGKYLCALDADDKLHPQFLARTVAVLRSRPEITFVSTRLQMFGLEQQIWPSTLRCDLPTLLAEDTVLTAALVLRSAVLAVGGYDEGMPAQGDEDWDLWLSLVEAGYVGTTLPDVLFYYRRREGSMGANCARGQTHIDLIRYLFRKHRESYRQHMLEVLLAKEVALGALRLANLSVERAIAADLQPAIERRRTELVRLTSALASAKEAILCQQRAEDVTRMSSKCGELGRELDAHRREYARALAEVAAVRSSASWRATAPFRSAYEWLKRMTAGR